MFLSKTSIRSCMMTLNGGRKHFCPCCLQAFKTAEKLKCRIKDCFKVNGK